MYRVWRKGNTIWFDADNLISDCEYCGNKSDERDNHGNCLGCGAPRPPAHSDLYGRSKFATTDWTSEIDRYYEST